MKHTALVTQFIVEEFLPDVGGDELDPDYDLVAGGVIDSLGLLKTLAWLEDRFDLPADEIDLAPDSFRTVSAISSFIERADQRHPKAG
ncbi:phosphopantetheine-binding protein [Streptomyces sp. NPDC047315]|uniref:phosphopantetheine-binding protein n=1 Tax=Streptomyces sp. NPDC047315 TaxID=3155142 RepID=UPI0033F86DE8